MRQRNERRIVFGEMLEFLVEHIAHKAHARERVVVENLAVYEVLVNAFTQQFGNDEVDILTGRSIGKGTGIGHHAGVDCLRHLKGDSIGTREPLDDPEDKLRRRASLGV